MVATLLGAAALAACGDTDAPDAVVIDRFSATPTEVAAGEPTTLTWAVQNATSIRIDAGGEALVSGAEATGTFETPALTEPTTFTLVASDGAVTARASVEVAVTAPATPVITELSADPNPVDFDDRSTIRWVTQGASAVDLTINRVDVVLDGDPSGEYTVTANETGGFLVRLTAKNGEDSVEETLVVDVNRPPGVEVEPNDGPDTATGLDDGRATAELEAGDVDFFVVEVPEDGWIRAETSNGAGGCAVDQQMELRDESGAVLATGAFGAFVRDFNGQPIGACRLIEPRFEAGARNLAAGRYYLRVVRGEFDPPTGPYVLDVEVGSAACGNGIIESGEVCDDGNAIDDDGCPTSCQIDPVGRIAAGDGARNVVSADLDPLGVAVVELEVDATSELVVITGSPEIGDCQAPIRVSLLDAADAGLAASDGFTTQQGFVPCGRIDPNISGEQAILQPGSYRLRFEPGLLGEAAAGFTSVIRLYEGSGCGNGFRSGSEICDDGDQDDDNRCSNGCTLNPLPVGADVPMSLQTTWDPFSRIRIRLEQAQTLSAEVTAAAGECTPTTTMGIIRAQTMIDVIGLSPAGVCAGVTQPEAAYARGLAAGDYDLVLLNGGTGVGQDLVIRTRGVVPECGNGLVEAGERCDDGNQVDNDLCRNDCSINRASVTEVEPNDDQGNAQTLTVSRGGPVAAVRASFAGGRDNDWYALDLADGASLDLFTYTAAGDRSQCAGVDTILELLDATGRSIVNNDDAVPGTLCSALRSTDPLLSNLAAGRYYVRVLPFPNSSPGPYLLDVEVR